VGVVIDEGADNIVVPAGGSIAVTGADTNTIEAGTLISLTKATLGPGTYTAVANKLTLGTNTELTVNAGGVLSISGETGVLDLTAATSKVRILPTGKVSVLDAAGKISDGETITNVKLFAGASTSVDTAVKSAMTVSDSDSDNTLFTLKKDGTGNNDVLAILGDTEFKGDTGPTPGGVSATSDDTAAAGSLKAGDDTVLTITGST
jgi:hypothetical protein